MYSRLSCFLISICLMFFSWEVLAADGNDDTKKKKEEEWELIMHFEAVTLGVSAVFESQDSTLISNFTVDDGGTKFSFLPDNESIRELQQVINNAKALTLTDYNPFAPMFLSAISTNTESSDPFEMNLLNSILMRNFQSNENKEILAKGKYTIKKIEITNTEDLTTISVADSSNNIILLTYNKKNSKLMKFYIKALEYDFSPKKYEWNTDKDPDQDGNGTPESNSSAIPVNHLKRSSVPQTDILQPNKILEILKSSEGSSVFKSLFILMPLKSIL